MSRFSAIEIVTPGQGFSGSQELLIEEAAEVLQSARKRLAAAWPKMKTAARAGALTLKEQCAWNRVEHRQIAEELDLVRAILRQDPKATIDGRPLSVVEINKKQSIGSFAVGCGSLATGSSGFSGIRGLGDMEALPVAILIYFAGAAILAVIGGVTYYARTRAQLEMHRLSAEQVVAIANAHAKCVEKTGSPCPKGTLPEPLKPPIPEKSTLEQFSGLLTAGAILGGVILGVKVLGLVKK